MVFLFDTAGALGTIAYFIVLPVLLLVGLGFGLQRRLGLDMPTLVRLNFYVVVPAMVFWAIVTSELSAGRLLVVVGFVALLQVLLGLATWGAMAVRGSPTDERPAAVMSQVFFNAGNYGLPLQNLAFRDSGLGSAAMGLQAIVMIVQNVTSFTVGVALAAAGGKRGDDGNASLNSRDILRKALSLPPLYALALAWVVRGMAGALSETQAESALDALRPFWDVLLLSKDAFMAIALLTLGAQLALVSRGGRAYPVSMMVVLRLLVSPVVALAMLWVWHLALGVDLFLAQVLLIASATPTAVNATLLCLEFDNHPDFVARAAFWSTAWSPVSVTAVILMSRTGLVPGV